MAKLVKFALQENIFPEFSQFFGSKNKINCPIKKTLNPTLTFIFKFKLFLLALGSCQTRLNQQQIGNIRFFPWLLQNPKINQNKHTQNHFF